MILRQIREYGVGICLLDQHPSLMFLPALGTYTTIAFNLRSEDDLRAMGAGLSLYGDVDYLSKLRVGQAIVKLQDRFLKPFLVQFPKVRFTDLHISSQISPRSRTEIISSTRTRSTDLHKRAGHSADFTRKRPLQPPDKHILRKALPLLLDIAKYPHTHTIARYQRLRLNPRAGNSAKEILVRKHFLSPVTILVGRTRIKLFEISELGKQCLRDHGIEIEHSKRKGSLEHQYWCHRAKRYFEKKGYSVLEEVEIGNGKTIDLVHLGGRESV